MVGLAAAVFVSLATTGTQTPPTLFGKPVNVPAKPNPQQLAERQSAFKEHLQRNGLVQRGDQIVRDDSLTTMPTPQGTHDETWHASPHHTTIYLNFLGGELSSGNNASEMRSPCIGGKVDYPGFSGTEAEALAIVQIFENAMAPYAVRVAYEQAPPQHLPYSMVMMGGLPEDIGFNGGALGVSCSSDCGDQWWRDTTFAFTESSSEISMLGTTALQEAAHAFGLDHIDGSQYIMNPFVSPGEKAWADECVPFNNATGGINCSEIHALFCEEEAQNDSAELMAYFGPNEPDLEPPVATIISPVDGFQLPVGGSTELRVEVSDNFGGVGWRILVTPPDGETVILNAYNSERSWGLNQLTAGTYEIAVEAIDHGLNEARDEVIVVVSGEATPAPDPNPGNETEDFGDESSGTGFEDSRGSGDAEGEPINDVDGPGGAPLVDQGGCVCAVRSSPPPCWELSLLGVFVTVRRRRPCAP